MNPWIKALVLVVTLLLSVGAGWTLGKLARIHPPALPVSIAIMVAGALGGPVLTYKLLGQSILSFMVALIMAGLAMGIIFWPMSEVESEERWF